MEDDLVFCVPDISICPKFSLDRHKPQSRLRNFHTLDYDEEMFIDLSYCDKAFSKSVNTNSLAVSLTDFSSLLANRKGSTSTPFRTAPSVDSKQAPTKQALGSVSEDSGFNESNVASTFANSCVIASPVPQRNKRPRDFISVCSIEETSSLEPLPCLSLEKRFENLLSDSDISNDSADVSLIDIHQENTQIIDDPCAKGTDNVNIHALSQALSNASSGYGSLCSQSSNFDIDASVKYADNHSQGPEAFISEQVVPEFTCDNRDNLYDELACKKTIEFTDITKDIQTSQQDVTHDSFSEKLRKVLDKFSPKDPERIIGRKIGLDNVDIVSELKLRNTVPPLDVLLRYVDGADLCSMCCVSTRWNDAVNTLARARRLTYVKSKREPNVEKENHRQIFKKASWRGLTGCKSEFPLGTLQQAGTPVKAPDSILQPQSKYQQFVQAAATLKAGESLRKCPKCSGPSRVHAAQERAVCLSKCCLYDFCIKCRRPFHGASDCVSGVNKKSRNDPPVGSKKSKQALRRL